MKDLIDGKPAVIAHDDVGLVQALLLNPDFTPRWIYSNIFKTKR